MNAVVEFAFDKSARYYDADGRLHVRMSNISKATVNPYRGKEIPGWQSLGLDSSKVYYLLRDPQELEAAAPTFNSIQILDLHVPVNAEEPMRDKIAGCLGSDANFSAPFLRNSLCIWTSEAIAGIESEDIQELSASYRYVPDMTPGILDGLHYDGVMRSIVGNHVALVESGRAGPDVVVSDSQIEGPIPMKTRTALMLSAGLRALVTPKLAADKAFDPSPLVANVTRKNYATSTADLAANVLRKVTPLLAADESMDVDDVVAVIGALQGAVPKDEPDELSVEATPAVDDDADGGSAKALAFLKGKLSDEDLASVASMLSGEAAAEPATDDDAPPAPKGKEDAPVAPKKDKDPPAMDANVIEAAAVKRMLAIRTAEQEVQPYVGTLAVAMDSAEAVYKFALEQSEVDLTGVHPSAFRAMLKLVAKPGDAATTRTPRVAMDAKQGDDFAKRFPTAKPLKRA